MSSTRPETTEAEPPGLLRRVAVAICKSRTCEGSACCQWPCNAGRAKCPVLRGGYDDAARDAIKVMNASR